MRPVVLVLLCAAAAGCGDDRPPAERRPAPDPRAAAERLASRCGLVAPQPGRIDAIVPDGLLPPGSYLTRARRSGSAARATVLLPLGIAAALDHLARAAPRAGYRVMFRESEIVEAELYLSGRSGLVKFRLYASQRCADASQALFERTYLSD